MLAHRIHACIRYVHGQTLRPSWPTRTHTHTHTPQHLSIDNPVRRQLWPGFGFLSLSFTLVLLSFTFFCLFCWLARDAPSRCSASVWPNEGHFRPDRHVLNDLVCISAKYFFLLLSFVLHWHFLPNANLAHTHTLITIYSKHKTPSDAIRLERIESDDDDDGDRGVVVVMRLCGSAWAYHHLNLHSYWHSLNIRIMKWFIYNT